MTKRTWNPKVKKRIRKHGFRKRMESKTGQNILKRRRAKNRSRLAVSVTKKK